MPSLVDHHLDGKLTDRDLSPDGNLSELMALRRWVPWTRTDGKKKPINLRTGMGASSTNPDDWVTFEEAMEALKSGIGYYAGLMFAMVREDGLVFIDLDKCRNPKNKGIHGWALEILESLDSYSEISPSETGVHVFVRATKPGELCRRGSVEMYDHARFACMTLRRLTRFPDVIKSRQVELDAIYQKHIAISQTDSNRSIPAVPAVPVPEEKLAALLHNPKASMIYKGEHNGHYQSQSEADLALMNLAVNSAFSEAECRTLIESARENAGADAKHDGYYQVTFQKARGDVRPVDLEEAREVFKRHMRLPETICLDVLLAIVASAHLQGDPCWMHIVGPPSSGKTEFIRSVDEWATVYALTELTPAGLVSGCNSEDGQDHSLLPKIHCKTLAIKDFTPTIDAPKDVRQKLFGRLRDAFDGSQSIHNAMVGTRSHKATFNCITGVTNAIEKVWRNTSLGERYLLIRHSAADPLESARRAIDGAVNKNEVRAQLRSAACGVLAGIDQDMVPTCNEEARERIAKLAAMLAMTRTFVERDRDHKVSFTPESEGPARLAQQLFKLGQGLALISRRSQIEDADLAILTRVAVDSIPLRRRQVVGVLVRERSIQTHVFINKLGISQSAVHEALEDLCALEICTKSNGTTVGHNVASEQGDVLVQINLNENAYTITAKFGALIEGIDFGTARLMSEMRNSGVGTEGHGTVKE